MHEIDRTKHCTPAIQFHATNCGRNNIKSSFSIALPQLFEVLHELFPGGNEARIDASYEDVVAVAVHVELFVETFHQATYSELGGAVANGAPKWDDT